MRKPVRVLLTGGGSGGHIIPNLAVVSAIKDREPKTQLLYIVGRGRLDADLLRQAGIPFKRIFSGKLRRYFSWRNFIDPLFVLLGFFQSLVILIRFWPNVVFSKGGFVSLPVVLAAFVLRRRIILHESDSRMGLANRIASGLADVVCVAFPNLVRKGGKYRLTGNPVRPEISNGSPEEGYRLTSFKRELPVLLVWGGSQGAAEINGMIEEDFEKFTRHFQIVHITGAGKSIRKKSPRYVRFEYLGADLRHIYAITDLVIGRAGANSLYEIAALKKPNIIIPLNNADQQGNARYFGEMGAALIYRQKPAEVRRSFREGGTKAGLFDLALNLWQNEPLQNEMKKSLARIAGKNASDTIAELILE